VAKFSASGKTTKKKDLGMIAMAYESVYVATVAFGSRDEQTLKAFIEAERYDGPSVIIAYSHCIAHGINMQKGFDQQKKAVDSGHWYLHWREHDGAAEWWQAGRVDPAQEHAGSGAWYWRVHSRIFHVRRYSVEPADAIPTLCAAGLSSSGMLTQCLVEGVEYLLLELGIDQSGDGVPDYYLRHPTARELPLAVSARIHLLQRGLKPLQGYRDSRQYRLGQTTLDVAGDGYLRRVFSATVQLRNAAVWPVAG
jgi:hypothetical protein